ncbi:MAG: hypothetical protein JO089_08915, partial [Alphaproteobacteria bacterium]|nr:hypothetical protein [Alphaproteobacteria bacterium]
MSVFSIVGGQRVDPEEQAQRNELWHMSNEQRDALYISTIQEALSSHHPHKELKTLDILRPMIKELRGANAVVALETKALPDGELEKAYMGVVQDMQHLSSQSNPHLQVPMGKLKLLDTIIDGRKGADAEQYKADLNARALATASEAVGVISATSRNRG